MNLSSQRRPSRHGEIRLASLARPGLGLTRLGLGIALGLCGTLALTQQAIAAPSGTDTAGQIQSGQTTATAGAKDSDTKRSRPNAKNSTTLGTITVTARERSESIQNVPIAITAFTSQQIIDAGIQSPADFVQLTPNVSMVAAQNRGTDFLTVRGISQVRNGQPPVATVVDGVQQVSPNQFNQGLYDIQSIEVLKGPQGALYGRNAVGGAILITTKPPSATPEAWVQLGVGNGNSRSGSFSLSGPIGNGRVRYLVAGMDDYFGGLIENTYLRKPVDGVTDQGLRARLTADMGDRFTLDTQANYSRSIGHALQYVFQPLFGIDDANDTSIPITSNNPGYDRRVLGHFSTKGDYRTDFGTLTSVVALDHINEYYDGDNLPYTPAISANAPLGPGTDGTQNQYVDTNAEQAELRFTSPSDQRLRWIAGASYLHTRTYLSTTTGLDLGLGIAHVQKFPAPADSISPTTAFFADHNTENTASVFGQVAYDLTPQLEADLAWRYDRNTHRQLNAAPVAFDPNSGQVRRATFSKGQPKFTLTYKPDSSFTLYGSYGVGFRVGGFNQSGTGALAATVGVPGVSDEYQPETAKTAELGFKSRLADDRLEIHGDVFDTQDRNQLYFVFVGDLGAQVLATIDKVKLQGYELSAQYRVVDDLTLFGDYGYTQSKIKRYTLNPDDVGNVGPYTPRYTSDVGLQYSPTLSNSLNGLFRVDYQVIGPQYWDPEDSTQRDAVKLLGLRAGISNWDGKWTATLWAKNATNTRYNAEYVLGGFTQIAEPRSYGIDFRYNFF